MALTLAACSSTTRQDENEPSGKFPVAVTYANFPASQRLSQHTHMVITFTQGGQLRFVDPRTFGELFVTTPDELTSDVTELADLGMDPVDEPQSWVKFREHLLSRTTKLKPLLMDQSFIAGLGNIYSDEILWEAGLRHDRLPLDRDIKPARRRKISCRARDRRSHS